MKRKILFALLATTTLLGTACGNGGGDSEVSTPLTVEEVQSALEKKSYENMDIMFDEMSHYTGQELIEAHIEEYDWVKEGELTNRQALELCVEEIFPALMDVEAIDTSKIFDADTMVFNEELPISFTSGYEQILERIDECETMPELFYYDREGHRQLESVEHLMASAHISLGGLGNYGDSESPFGAIAQIEVEKYYDCRLDDLSDTYMLIDGEKSVAEAKEEMEQYLNEHYPLLGRKNGISDYVWKIGVGKIAGTEYYAFRGMRTLSYNGIPFRESDRYSGDWELEEEIMAECALCETGKVDVTLGPFNRYTEPEVRRTITEPIPFAEVLERVSYYLTGETKFQLLSGGLEYRLFKEQDETGAYIGCRMVPYWRFIAKDPNDDTMMKIYVDIETGEVDHREYVPSV